MSTIAGFGSAFKQAADFRPMLNIGCLFDVQTGRYVKGMKGENILNGGTAQIEGVTGPGNSMKSTLCKYRQLSVLSRYANASALDYDTENSATRNRSIELGMQLDPSGTLSNTLTEEAGRLIFTTANDYTGSEWFDIVKKQVKERLKTDKKIDTPFIDDITNKCMQTYAPVMCFVDSFSQFFTDTVTDKMETATVGSGDMNAVAMQSSGGKAQVMDALPSLTGKSGLYFMLTAHMGEQIVLDKYNAPMKKLWGVKGNKKMKKVPESFNFLTNNLFEIVSLSPLINQTSKLAEFPRDESDDMKGNTDLMVATVVPIRTKSGVTGIPVEYIFSQTHGLQPSLTEYWYCKTYNRFGLSSNVVTQYFEIYPDVKFTRNNIREKFKEDAKLRRAAEITSELCQINNLMPELALSLLVTPEDLYKGLKEKGYDWDVLLNTRGYWTFDQYTHPIPFLSTKDLLEMYHGLYHPYWMEKK